MGVRPHDAAIITRYEPAVRRFCRTRTRSPEDADDAVQDTFIRFLRRSDAVIRNEEAWLITAASRACADINRKHQRDEERGAPLPEHEGIGTFQLRSTASGADPEQLTVEQLTISALLRKMSPRDRFVVTHLYLLGASTEKVAKYLGVSNEHLRTIAMRARRHAQHIARAMEQTTST